MDKDKLKFDEIFEDREAQPEDFNTSLDIADITVDVKIEFETPKSDGDKEDFIKDIQYVRSKLLNGIGQADKILTSLLKKIIIDDEMSSMPDSQPKGYHKYYEASTELLKSICDSSKELLNLHMTNIKTKKEMNWIAPEEDKEEVNTDKPKEEKSSGTLSNIVNKFKVIKKDENDANENNYSNK